MDSCNKCTDADTNRYQGDTETKTEQDSEPQDVDNLTRKLSEQAYISDQNSASADGEGQHHEALGITSRPNGAEDEGSPKQVSESSQPPFPTPEKLARLRDLQIYKMNPDPLKSIAVIITYSEFDDKRQNRPAGEHDAKMLRNLFADFGFKVIPLVNQNSSDLHKELTAAARGIEKETDCLVVAVSSHGDGDDICTFDTTISIPKLASYFSTTRCPNLEGKPKLFFIQACRGDLAHTAKSGDSYDQLIVKVPRLLHKEADFLVAYSSPPGYMAYNDKNNGSYFFLALCEVFKSFARTMDLQTMLTRVSNLMVEHNVPLELKNGDQPTKEVAHAMLPSFVSQLTKDFSFNREKIQKNIG